MSMTPANAEATLKNLLDHFVPNTKLLVVAGKNLLKCIQSTSLALSQYSDILNRLAADSQLTLESKEIGESLREMVSVVANYEKSHSSATSFFKQKVLERMEADVDADPKLIMDNLRAYQLGKKRHSKKVKEVHANLSQARKKHFTKAHGQQHVEQEIMKLEREAVLSQQQLDDYEMKYQQIAGNEERKRYSYILDRHCQLLKIYLDTHNEAAEPLKIGFAKWSGRINNRTLPEPIPSSYSRTDRAASGIYEELEEMRSRETSELIEDVPSKAEITTNFSSVPQQDKQNFEKFIEDTFKASLDEHFAEALDAGYQSFRKSSGEVPPEPSQDALPKRFATALHYYNPSGDHQLKLEIGDPVEVLKDGKEGWQFGINLATNEKGWFPASRVEEIRKQRRSSIEGIGAARQEDSRISTRPQSLLFTPDPKQYSKSKMDEMNNGYTKVVKPRRSEPPRLSQQITPVLPTVPEWSAEPRKGSKVTFATSPPATFESPASPSASEESASPSGNKVVVVLPPKLDLHHTNFDTVPRNNPFGHVNLRRVITTDGVPKKLV